MGGAYALPSPPLSTTHCRPVVVLEKGSSASDQSEDDVDGAAHTSKNEERKDGDADQRGDLESADHSDREEDRSTSEHENRDCGVCYLPLLLPIQIHESLLLEGMNQPRSSRSATRARS